MDIIAMGGASSGKSAFCKMICHKAPAHQVYNLAPSSSIENGDIYIKENKFSLHVFPAKYNTPSFA